MAPVFSLFWRPGDAVTFGVRAPLQGSAFFSDTGPRALPWAIAFCPVGAPMWSGLCGAAPWSPEEGANRTGTNSGGGASCDDAAPGAARWRAPTARPALAQGNALGFPATKGHQALKGRHNPAPVRGPRPLERGKIVTHPPGWGGASRRPSRKDGNGKWVPRRPALAARFRGPRRGDP